MTSRGAEKMNNDTIGVDVSKDHLDAHRRWPTAPPGVLPMTSGRSQSAYQMARGDAFIPGRVRTDRALSSRRRNARWASLAFRSSRSIPVRRAASLKGDRQAGEDRSPGCGDPGSYGKPCWNWRRAQPEAKLLFELKKELYVAREALVKDRTAAKNRGKVLTLSLLKRQNTQRLEQIDRQIA